MEITTAQIRKVRRSAISAKKWSPCVSCKVYGNRCSQSRPCTRCSKLGRPCVKLDEIDYQDGNQQTSSLVAERPLKFRAGLKIDHESLPSIQLHPNLLWASIELMKNTAVGHDVDSLTDFFQSLTLYQSSALLTAMNDAVSLVNCIDQPFQPTPPETSHDEVQSFTATGGRNCSQYWDMDTVTASLRTTFDPATRRRRAIIANARQAALYGMHPEEFQVRAARPTIVQLLRSNPPHQRILYPCKHPSGPYMHRVRVTRAAASHQSVRTASTSAWHSIPERRPAPLPGSRDSPIIADPGTVEPPSAPPRHPSSPAASRAAARSRERHAP